MEGLSYMGARFPALNECSCSGPVCIMVRLPTELVMQYEKASRGSSGPLKGTT